MTYNTFMASWLKGRNRLKELEDRYAPTISKTDKALEIEENLKYVPKSTVPDFSKYNIGKPQRFNFQSWLKGKSVESDVVSEARQLNMSPEEIAEIQAIQQGTTVKPSMQIPQSLAETSQSYVQELRTIPAEEAIKKIQSIETLPKETWKESAQRNLKNAGQFIPFASSAIDYFKLSTANNAAQAIMEGKPVSEKELEQLYEFVYKSSVDKSFGANVVDILAKMPSYAGEIAATGGIYKGVQAGTTSALKKLIGDAVSNRLVNLAVRGIAGAAGAGIAGIPAAAIRTPAGTMERQTFATLTGQEESLLESTRKAFGTAWVEAASERTGGAFDTLTAPLKNQLMKIGLFKAIQKLNPLKSNAQINKLFQTFGYNGVLGEMFEERVADIGHAMLGTEPFKLPSGEQLLTELVAFSIPSVAGRAVNTTASLTNKILQMANEIEPMPAHELNKELPDDIQMPPSTSVQPGLEGFGVQPQSEMFGEVSGRESRIEPLTQVPQRQEILPEQRAMELEGRRYELEADPLANYKVTLSSGKKVNIDNLIDAKEKTFAYNDSFTPAQAKAIKPNVTFSESQKLANGRIRADAVLDELADKYAGGDVSALIDRVNQIREMKAGVRDMKVTTPVEPVPEVTPTSAVTTPEVTQTDIIKPPSEPPKTIEESPIKKPVRQAEIPSAEDLIDRVYEGKITGLKGKVFRLPVVRVAGKLVNPIGISDDPGITMRAISGMIDDTLSGGSRLAMARINELEPNIKNLFKLDEKGIVKANDIIQIEDLPGGKQSLALHDIIENAQYYYYGDTELANKRTELIEEIRETSEDFSNMLRNEGILVPKGQKTETWQIEEKEGESGWVYLHRLVTNIKEESADSVSRLVARTIKDEGIAFTRNPGETDYQYVARFSQAVSDGTIETTTKINNLLNTFANLADVEVKKTSLSDKRKWATVAEGLSGGTTYEANPIEELRKQISSVYQIIKKLRVSEIVKNLIVTTTPTEQAEAELNVNSNELYQSKTNSSNLVSYIQRAIRGESLPGASITAINKNYPDIGKQLSSIYDVLPKDRNKVINKVIGEVIRSTRITQKEVSNAAKRAEISSNIRLAFKPFEAKAKITIQDIEAAVNQNVRDKSIASKLVRDFYTSIAKNQRETLRDLLEQAKVINESDSKKVTEFEALREKFAERMGSFGTVEYGKVTGIPGLGNRVIPSQMGKYGQEIADEIRNHFGYMSETDADKAIKAVGKVGTVMRLFKLGFDLSATLIQQSLSLGYDIKNAILLRPTATWAKATGGAIKTLTSKNMVHLDAFIADNWEITKDFIERGGLVEIGESVEGAESIKNLIDKVSKGKVKAIGEFINKHLFGRSEIVFTTGRVEAAINMYKAGYKQAKADGQLDAWAKLVNKMTGVLSSKALGVGKWQRDIEGTFVFMSPRFTRASGAIIYDILANPSKYTYKEAATSLAALIGAFAALAMAINSADDNDTSLNPFDPDFLKIYVGDRVYRIGGIVNDVRRLVALIDTLAYYTTGGHISLSGKEDNTPLMDELLFSQFRGKTSPITGTVIDIINMLTNEYATNFEGEPLTWKGILGEWISPVWLDPIINSEVNAWQGSAGEIIGLTSFEDYKKIKSDDIKYSISKLGKKDIDKRQEDVLNATTPRDIEIIKEKDYTHTTVKLGSEINESTRYYNEYDEFPPIVNLYWKDKEYIDAYYEMEKSKAEEFRKNNYRVDAALVIWKGFKTFSNTKTESYVKNFTKVFDIPISSIPIFMK